MVELTERELTRYDRQMRIQNFGKEGQKKLKVAKVVIAGLGGLGSPASIYLAVAGVGNLLLIDKEKAELSNLNRQILHWDKDVDRYKVDSAIEKLKQMNPDINVEGKITEINEDNVYSLIKGANVVVDCMDNFRTRFILNKACVKLRIPFVHAAVYGLEGRQMTIIPYKGPCLQCLIPEEPPEIKPFPVLGATPAVMACLQAIETIKLITGIGKPNIGRLLVFDGLEMSFESYEISRDPNCSICGKKD